MADPGTVVLDGEHDMAVLAARGAAPNARTFNGRVAAVAEPVLGEAARATLSNSGYAAWDPNVGAWREAAAAMGGVTLVCQGVTTNDPVHQPDLLRDIPEGATARPWWRTAPRLVLPASRSSQHEADRRHADAVAAAARCAVAALLGPA
jgi:hypothetical protein